MSFPPSTTFRRRSRLGTHQVFSQVHFKVSNIFSRRLRDVLWGLSSLFSDLLNFEDPLNIEAADHFRSDQEGFRTKVRDWVVKYAKR